MSRCQGLAAKPCRGPWNGPCFARVFFTQTARLRRIAVSRKEFVAWDIPEPFKESKEPPWKILPIKHNASVRGLVLSDAIVGVKTHWINNRTKPCITQQRGCEACSHGVAWRWKGYLAVWLVASRTGWLLEVTQWAFDHNLQLSCTEGLRGLDFIAKRTKPANNAPVEIDL